MTPRIDVIALDKNEPFNVVLKTIEESGFSRMPVFDDSFDNVIGIIVIKDLLKHLDKPNDFQWYHICRPAFFVPETKKIDDLLKEFQSKKNHMAIIVDEYGGAGGLVTLEDIIEEIVGDINDEFDDEEAVYSKLDENNYVFEGKIGLNDFYRITEIDESTFDEYKGDADTLAEMLIEHKGKIPRKGEKITLHNYLFTIESAEKRRVRRIKFTKLDVKE